jgi:hypothetical protein
VTVFQVVDNAACWTYVDERDIVNWKVIVKDPTGQWMEIDDGGVSYNVTVESLTKFIDDWITDAKADPDGVPMPSDDTIEVYRQAAEFVASHT